MVTYGCYIRRYVLFVHKAFAIAYFGVFNHLFVLFRRSSFYRVICPLASDVTKGRVSSLINRHLIKLMDWILLSLGLGDKCE